MDWALFLVLAVIFVATFVRSAFGFGEALIAVPLLALLIPIEVAAPVAALVSITVAAVVLVQDWRQVNFRSAGRLALASALGTPLGLLLLLAVAEPVVKGLLAVVILAFSLHSLLSPARAFLKNDKWAWLFGFGAGILGGAYGMNGPPLVVYGTLRQWSPQRFRGTLQGYFLPASIIVMGGYAFAGLWTPAVNRWYLLSLPVILLAILMGRACNQRMNRGRFLLCIHSGLILVGSALLYQAVR